MKPSALALMICLAFACVGYAQDSGQIASQPVRVDPKVMEAKVKHKERPKYPDDAKAAQVVGTVVMQVIIGKDGSVREAKLISGPPMLVKAAQNAVKKWKYEPTLLNGEPVEVSTMVSIAFSLDKR